MNAKTLLHLSTQYFDAAPYTIEVTERKRVFNAGAKWMFLIMNALQPDKKMVFDDDISYHYYGFLKYGVCLFFFGIALVVAFLFNMWLIPLTILLFYLVEVHFLFLFPLLIDGVKKPFLIGIQHVYRIGILRVVFTVFQIGVFMMVGLLRYKNPLRNWYIGCLSIVIWYQKEVRDSV